MIGFRSNLKAVILAAAFLLLATGGVAEGQTVAADAEEASLYERLGGLQGISLVASSFVDIFVTDRVIMENDAVRERKSPETAPYIKYQLITLVCQATGGPCEYTGLDLRTAHDGLNVSEREWDRMVEIFVGVLDLYRVPEQEKGELLAILGPTKDDIVVTGSR